MQDMECFNDDFSSKHFPQFFQVLDTFISLEMFYRVEHFSDSCWYMLAE